MGKIILAISLVAVLSGVSTPSIKEPGTWSNATAHTSVGVGIQPIK